MVRRVVGYEGEGRHRRTIYADEGPARARAGGVLDALGSVTSGMVGLLAGGEGAGAIERRQITDAEAAARVRPGKAREVRMSVAPCPSASRVAPIEIPCPGCIHAPVCTYRAALEAFALDDVVLPAVVVRVTAIAFACAEFYAVPVLVSVPTGPARIPSEAEKPTNAERMAASRRRGAERHVRQCAEQRARGDDQATTRQRKSPETRERMRLAQLALAERRRAAKAAAAETPAGAAS